jgi:proteasome lid subunit RPN8/RPN11
MKITEQAQREILAHAANYPDVEVTGYVCEKTFPGSAVAQWTRQMTNMSNTPESEYAWGVREMKDEWADMDRLHRRPIAIYHSHPGGKPDPSETDMKNAMQPGMFYLIAYPESIDCRTGGGELIRRDKMWCLTAWECLELGVLVQADLKVLP